MGRNRITEVEFILLLQRFAEIADDLEEQDIPQLHHLFEYFMENGDTQEWIMVSDMMGYVKEREYMKFEQKMDLFDRVHSMYSEKTREEHT